MAVDPFESPKLLLDAARNGIDEFEAASNAFLAEDGTAVFVTDLDAKRSQKTYKIRFPKQVPAKLRVLAYDVVGYLRHSIDQALNASIRELTGSKRKAYFPFADNPRALDQRLQAPVKKGSTLLKIPVELHPLIRGFEPYPRGDKYEGGDEALAGLGNLAGPNKHDVIIAVGANFNEVQLLRSENVGRMTMFTPPGFGTPPKDEVELLTLSPLEANADLYVPLQIVFNEPAVMGVQVLGAFDTWLPKVGKILAAFESETTKILASRR